MTATIFIDGEAGTTGLQIRERLEGLSSVRLASLPGEKRKDVEAKKALLREVDLVILCLPDAAAKETVALVDALGEKGPRILDASTAHRVAPGWVFGFAEMTRGQDAAIAKATRVSNPGCYPTGAIGLLRPLVEADLIAPDAPVTINAVSGYTGGGKAMIAEHQAGTAPAFELYGLGLEHKHAPEILAYSKLTRRPIFVPSVGSFAQGMLVSIPLHLDTLPGAPGGQAIADALARHYEGSRYVTVFGPGDASHAAGKIEPESLNNTNKMELHVFANEARGQAVLVAKLDNLGKGASGAAVQNMELMLGL